MSQLYLPHGTENIFFKRRKIRKETKNKNRLCSEEMVRNMKIIQDMYNSPHLYKTKIQMQKKFGEAMPPLASDKIRLCSVSTYKFNQSGSLEHRRQDQGQDLVVLVIENYQ